MTIRGRSIREDAEWSFETSRFFIGLYAIPEVDDPADFFEDPADVEFAESGDLWAWCTTSVRVFVKGDDDQFLSDWIEVGSDHLGGCSYLSREDFVDAHRSPDPMQRNCSLMRVAQGGNVVICEYFTSMVREAVAAARQTLRNVPTLRAA